MPCVAERASASPQDAEKAIIVTAAQVPVVAEPRTLCEWTNGPDSDDGTTSSNNQGDDSVDSLDNALQDELDRQFDEMIQENWRELDKEIDRHIQDQLDQALEEQHAQLCSHRFTSDEESRNLPIIQQHATKSAIQPEENSSQYSTTHVPISVAGVNAKIQEVIDQYQRTQIG